MARNKVRPVALIAMLVSGHVFAQPAAGTTRPGARLTPPRISVPSLLRRTEPFRVVE